MNYYERHIGDYLKDTAHLSLLEHGVYGRLLDVYYTRESGIPADQVERLIGARSREERAALATVLAEFFRLDGETHTHSRCEREIARLDDKRKKASASAFARWKKPEAHSDGNANAMRTHCEGNAPSHQTPDTNEIPIKLTLDSGFPAEKPALSLVASDTRESRSVPKCPHAEVLALWAEVLPAMPQHNPELWRGSRADHLRARWRETAAAKGWATDAEGLTYFRRLFGYVGQSRFLTGRAGTKGDKPPFVCTLEWLVKASNWAKVLEGNYHPEAA